MQQKLSDRLLQYYTFIGDIRRWIGKTDSALKWHFPLVGTNLENERKGLSLTFVVSLFHDCPILYRITIAVVLPHGFYYISLM